MSSTQLMQNIMQKNYCKLFIAIVDSTKKLKFVFFPTILRNIPFIRKYLSISSCDLYALESMIYMTAGIIDAYENPKVDLESSIVKAYSQECLLKISRAALNFFDHAVTTKGHPIEEDIRNAIQLQYHGESTQALKSYIGLAGLNHSNVSKKKTKTNAPFSNC